MSADKRSVSTDALETLGMIIDETQKRDAIHIAVEPVVAGEKRAPGEHITVKDGVATGVKIGEGLGIVDPFLTQPVKQGQRFWFLMYPRQVRSLRHVWSHPDFADEPVVESALATPAAPAPKPPVPAIEEATAEQWIRAYADSLNVGYKDLVDSARYFLESGEYMCRGAVLDGEYTSKAFWGHFEKLTGIPIPAEKRENFFTCSC